MLLYFQRDGRKDIRNDGRYYDMENVSFKFDLIDWLL